MENPRRREVEWSRQDRVAKYVSNGHQGHMAGVEEDGFTCNQGHPGPICNEACLEKRTMKLQCKSMHECRALNHSKKTDFNCPVTQ